MEAQRRWALLTGHLECQSRKQQQENGGGAERWRIGGVVQELRSYEYIWVGDPSYLSRFSRRSLIVQKLTKDPASKLNYRPLLGLHKMVSLRSIEPLILGFLFLQVSSLVKYVFSLVQPFQNPTPSITLYGCTDLPTVLPHTLMSLCQHARTAPA
jgi:hypothetical protein